MADPAWEDLSRILRSSAPYKTLLQGLGDVVRLPVPAAAWVGELLARDLGRPVLVLVPREADALTWMEAARLFGREEGIVYFPAPSLTPYQETETSLMVRAQESVALDCVASGRLTTVVATPRALFRRLPDREEFLRSVLTVRPNEDHPIEGLVAHLIRHGFRRTDLVYEVGDFAVRGGIVDLFPPGEETPDPPRPLRRHRGVDPLVRPPVAALRGHAGLASASFPSPSSPPAPTRRGSWPISSPAARRPIPTGDPRRPSLLEGLRTRGEFPGWENYPAAARRAHRHAPRGARGAAGVRGRSAGPGRGGGPSRRAAGGGLRGAPRARPPRRAARDDGGAGRAGARDAGDGGRATARSGHGKREGAPGRISTAP